MFSWFKRKKSFLSDWNFDDLSEFRRIDNPDSVQYVNADFSRIVYFSSLIVSGAEVFSSNLLNAKLIISERADGWDIKGSKTLENKVLVCLISVNDKEDIDWAETFFNSIVSA